MPTHMPHAPRQVNAATGAAAETTVASRGFAAYNNGYAAAIGGEAQGGPGAAVHMSPRIEGL